MSKSTNVDNASSVYGGAFSCVGGSEEGGGGGSGEDYRFNELNFTIPAADVDGDLTAMPLAIEHGRHVHFPAEVWAASAGTINVAIKDGADVMTEVLVFDATRQKLRIGIQANLSSTVDNEFTITWHQAPTVTGTVFADYAMAVSFYGMYQGQTDADVVDVSGNGATFTARENTAPNPLFEDDAFKTGSQHNALAYLMDTPVNGNKLYMSAVAANNTISSGYPLSLEETGGGQFTELGMSANGGTNILTTFFATYSGGNYLSSSDGDTLVGEYYHLAGWTDHLGTPKKAAFMNGGNKTTLSGWEENDTDHDNGYIGTRADQNEGLYGSVREVRILGAIPSDEYVAFEALNMNGESLAYDYGVPVLCSEQEPIPAVGIDYTTMTVTVPASHIDAALTDFPLVIENKLGAGNIPSEWFEAAAIGTISVETEAGGALQTEVAYFDAAKSVLRVHVKVDLSSTEDNVFKLIADKAPTVTGTVFDAYELVVPVSYADNIEGVKDFSSNDFSGSANWTHSIVGSSSPVFNGDGRGLGFNKNNLYTDSISIADDLYLVADATYGTIGTMTVAGLSDADGSMDGLMLRNLSTYGRVASYGDSSGGWLETDNTDDAALRNVGERWVGSLTYESGVERSVFRDGIGKGTDLSVEDPFTTKTRCTIGCRDNLSEDLVGIVYEVRAAGFIPSDAWVKAEALNMGKNELYQITGEYVAAPTEKDAPYVVANVYSPYDTDTTQTVTIPEEAETGDLLVLIGFTRATRTEPATGWNEHVNRVETGTGEVDQALYVLSKVYDGLETTVEFGSASSVRMGFCLTVVRGGTGIEGIIESDIDYRDSDGLEYTLPTVLNGKSVRRLCMQAYTSSYTENSNSATLTTNTFSGADALTLNNPRGGYGATNSWARLGAFAFELEGGESKALTLPYCAIENRAAPVIPHCYFFVTGSSEEGEALEYLEVSDQVYLNVTSVDGITDKSPMAHGLTLNGGVVADSGSILFDGDSDWIDVPHHDAHSIGNSRDIVIQATINLDSTATDAENTIVSKRASTGATEYSFYVYNNELFFVTYISGSIDAVAQSGGADIVDDTEYFVEAKRTTGGVWKIYIDGTEVGTDTESGTPTGNTSGVRIGANPYSGGRDFKGLITNVKIYLPVSNVAAAPVNLVANYTDNLVGIASTPTLDGDVIEAVGTGSFSRMHNLTDAPTLDDNKKYLVTFEMSTTDATSDIWLYHDTTTTSSRTRFSSDPDGTGAFVVYGLVVDTTQLADGTPVIGFDGNDQHDFKNVQLIELPMKL